MRERLRIVALILVIAVPVLAWATRHKDRPDPRLLPGSEVDLSNRYSNVLPEDYLGPQSCVQCHAGKYRLWSKHPHRCMNQLPSTESVRGDFSGAVLSLANGSVHFDSDAGQYRMTVMRQGRQLRRYRITRTVGSRYIQFYIGVEEEGPEPPDHPCRAEHLLPFAWWMSVGQWLPKHYCDLNGPEKLCEGVPQEEGLDKLEDVRPWNTHCVHCHNTTPYAYRGAYELFRGFREASVSLAVGQLGPALRPHIAVDGDFASFDTLNQRLEPDRHLVTLGISCESCHFGGREHVLSGGKMSFLPTSPFLKLTARREDRPLRNDRKSPATLTGICTQCHAANVTLYPDGVAQCNSREGLDFSRSACASQMTCTHCHEPHTAGAPEGAATSPAHVAACKKCHGRYADDKAALAHARHPASAGVTCLDCHMPRQVLGLDTVVRTHKVGMPVEEPLVAKGMANACNLCHLDQSSRWGLTELQKGWGRTIQPQPSWPCWDDLDRPAGQAWLKGPDAGMRMIATQSYMRSPLGKRALPELIGALNDSEPVNRIFAQRAIEALQGRPLHRDEFDVTDPPALRQQKIGKLLEPKRVSHNR